MYQQTQQQQAQYNSESQQVQNSASNYCYDSKPPPETAQRSDYEAGSSAEFASVFATLYSVPPQNMGGGYQNNVQGDSFYQPEYYQQFQQLQQSAAMHPNQQMSQNQQLQQQNTGYGYQAGLGSYDAQAQSCYMGGDGGHSIKSEYVILKEQQDASILTQFYMEKCALQQAMVEEGIKQTLLKEVEQQEPRFVYQLMNDGSEENAALFSSQDDSQSISNQNNMPQLLPSGKWQRIPSICAISTTEFQVVLYLNQMAVFNCIDDGSLPGYAALKLCDGRKRSMSLWVEFITASGYLSAKKLRSRFQLLLMNAVEKNYSQASHVVRFNQSSGSLVIYNKYIVSVVPGFKCRGCWPSSARAMSTLPAGGTPLYVADKSSPEGRGLVGFTLIANEVAGSSSSSNSGSNVNPGFTRQDGSLIPPANDTSSQNRRPATSADSDTWQISIDDAERNLLQATGSQSPPHSYASNAEMMPISGRSVLLRILKTLRDNVEGLGGLTNHQLSTLVLWEWEKHPGYSDWLSTSLPDRLRSVMLQLINCLQNQRLDHYLLANVNILSEPLANTTQHPYMARQVWHILRQLTFNFTDILRIAR